jgi:hypothetical protein
MTPHILLLWTMATSPITETDHGGWRYLGTYQSETFCAQAAQELSNYTYHIFGTFRCIASGVPQQDIPPKAVVRY